MIPPGITRICAFDIALGATGYCQFDEGNIEVSTIKGPKGLEEKPMERLDWLLRDFDKRIGYDSRTLTVFEDLYIVVQPGNAPRMGLLYLLKYTLWCTGRPFVAVSPGQLKKFVSGKGNTAKTMIPMHVVQRFKVEVANDDEADAVGLNFIGRALTGLWEPTTESQTKIVSDLLSAPKPKKPRKRSKH